MPEEVAQIAPEVVTRPLKILICIPSHGDCKTGFAYSLARAMVHFASMPYDGEKALDVDFIKSSLLPETRTRLVSRAYKFGATHILWLDTDMKFPPDTIARLLNHNKMVVGANYSTKEIESRPVAYREDEDYVGPVWTQDSSKGLQQVTFLGMGVMLTDIRVFDVLKLPWFVFDPLPPDFIKQSGEDGYFCHKLREAEFEVFIDHDLSKQVVHIGDAEYTTQHAVLSQQTKLQQYDDLPGGIVIP